MMSAEQNLTPFPYPATESLLPSPLKPQLLTSPKVPLRHLHSSFPPPNIYVVNMECVIVPFKRREE